MATREKVSANMEIFLSVKAGMTLIPDATYELYFKMLQDIPEEILDAGAKELIANGSPFFPSIAEWRKAAFDIMVGNLNIPTAAEAWEEVRKEMSRCGAYWQFLSSPHVRLPMWSHPMVEKAVSCLGYRQIYESENQVADRAHFLKVYAELLSRAMANVMMLPDTRKAAEEYQARLEQGRAGEISSSIKMLAGRMGK